MIANPLRRLPGARWGVSGAAAGLLAGLPLAVFVPLVRDSETRAWLAFGMGLIAAWYGGFRVVRSHPAQNRAYREWLARTPWRWPQPLPHRSPYLSVNDAAFVIAMAALSPWGMVTGLSFAGFGFLIGYVATVASLPVEDRGVMGLGGIVLTGCVIAGLVGVDGPSGLSTALALITALGLSQVSLRNGLKRMSDDQLTGVLPPKKESQPIGSPYRELLEGLDEPREDRYGWASSVAVILFLTACTEFFLHRANAWAALVDPEVASSFEVGRLALNTLVYFGRVAYHDSDPLRVHVAVVAGIGLFLTLPTLLGSLGGGRSASPISLLGRVATGRLIIPGNDIYVLSALACCSTYGLVGWLLIGLGAPPVATGGISLALATVVYAQLAPDPRDWRLTGHHRIVLTNPVMAKKQAEIRARKNRGGAQA